MIRFILVMLILFLYLILGIPVLGVEWLIGKCKKETSDYQCLRMVQWAFRLILKVAGVEINRKMLAEMAVNDAAGFAALAELAKSKVA